MNKWNGVVDHLSNLGVVDQFGQDRAFGNRGERQKPNNVEWNSGAFPSVLILCYYDCKGKN